MGVGTVVFVAVMLSVLAAIGVKVLVDAIRDQPPRTLPQELADRLEWQVWNPTGRHAVSGDTWPEHDEDADEDGCWCRGCFEVELELMQDAEIFALFAGLVDTPELRELADRARRGIR
ncbi:hypothetical protein ABGB07_02125 [Micromonosporaceae bacterium B7E4]